MVTTNDSGDAAAALRGRARAPGRTVGRHHFHAGVDDVEALAPAGARARSGSATSATTRGSRTTVSVYRVTGGHRADRRRPAPRYRLAYPDGAHNAESLFVDRDRAALRRHQVASSAARSTGAPAQLTPPASTGCSPSGRVARVRHRRGACCPTAGTCRARTSAAGVYTFPASSGSARFALPRQRQGEGISVGPGGGSGSAARGAQPRSARSCLPARPSAAAHRHPRPRPPPPRRRPSASPSPVPAPAAAGSPSPRPPRADAAPALRPTRQRRDVRQGIADARPAVADVVDPRRDRGGRARHRPRPAAADRVRLAGCS